MLRASLFTGLSLVLVAIAVALFPPRFASSTNVLRRVTTTGEEVMNLNPSLSGDGLIVTFESTANLAGVGGGNGFRAIRADLSANTAAFTQLGMSRAVAPAISQDGSRIAFASNEDLVGSNPDRNSEIFLFDGSGVRQITNTTPQDISTRISDGNFQPSIADDGRLIAFASNRNFTGLNADLNFEIVVVDTNTSIFTQLTNSQDVIGSTEAKISGDGSQVAFARDGSQVQSNSRDLLRYDRTRGETVVLATNRPSLSMTYGRAISDDGSRVVYSAEIAPDQSQVFLFDARTNTTTQVTSLAARLDDVPLHPTISGDGKRIAFATRRNVIGGNNDRSVELYVYDIPTAQLTRLTDAPASATAAVVSSLNDDGMVAAFNFPRALSGSVSANDLAGNSEIYVTTIEPRPAFGSLTVLNAAAHGNEPGPEQTLAPDSIAIGSGTALATRTEQAERSSNGSFPLSLAGTTLSVNGRAATILYVSPALVTFVVPPETELGSAEVMLTNADGFQSRTNVTIIASAPGLFTLSGDGRGESVVLDADTLLSSPLDPTGGQLRILVFATGARGGSHLSATIAGRSVIVESLQRSRDLPGLDELHILVPSDLRGAGTVSLTTVADNHESNVVEVTLNGSFERDILINELLTDPPDGLAGDANHDGVRNSADDEFVELVNTTTRDIDLSGYELQTRGATGPTDILRHRFAAGTVLPAGTAIVVFGGGDPDAANPAFGGAPIYKASSGGLSLLNSGGVVTLTDSSSIIVTFLTYGGSTGLPGDANESLTRSPDVTGDFRLHQSAPEGDGRLFSPGTRLNGTAFLPRPAISKVLVSPASMSLTAGEEFRFTAKAFDQHTQELGGVIFGWQSNDTAVATVDEIGLVKAVATGTAQIMASARGVQSTPAVLIVTTPSPTPSPSPAPSPRPSPSPEPSPSATPSPLPSPSPTPMSRVVISEFRTRGPGGASDEFVELYNSGDTAIDVGGWKVKGSGNAGTVSTRLTISTGVAIPSRGHLLITNSGGYSGSVLGDQTFATGIANDGGIALTLPDDAVVDQVGMSAGSAFREGMHLAPLPSDANQSYERKPGGLSGSGQDTTDNFNDFQLISPSDPQNVNNDPTPGPSPTPSPSPSVSPSPSPSASPTPSPTPVPTPTPTPFPSPSPSPSPSPDPTPTVTPTPNPSPSPSPSPIAATAVVISELRTRGPNGASDEFVELYNNSDLPIAIAGWKIRGSSNSGNISTRLVIATGTIVPARGHFLATNSGYSGLVVGDQTYTSGIANDGGIALTLPDDSVVDQVGLSAGSGFKEGMHIAPLPGDANQSYERKPGGSSGSTQDTNDNFVDFQLLTPSDPQNLSAHPTPGPSPTPVPTPSPSPSPTPLPVPSPSPSPTPSPSPSPTPTPLTKLVISQIYGGGGNSGAPFRNDFIELFNAGSSSISLAGWSVQYAGATGTSWSVTELTPVALAPGQYYLIQESSGGSNGANLPPADATGVIAMAATAGKVALVNVSTALSGACPADETIVDLVGYGSTANCFRGVGPTVAPSNTNGILRKNNGCTETSNNQGDFAAEPPNPRNTTTPTNLCAGALASRIGFANTRRLWRELLALAIDPSPLTPKPMSE